MSYYVPNSGWTPQADTTITFHDPKQQHISMHAGGVEMLRVAPEGFYVRGIKVPADEKETLAVYNGFKQFLTWAELNRR